MYKENIMEGMFKVLVKSHRPKINEKKDFNNIINKFGLMYTYIGREP